MPFESDSPPTSKEEAAARCVRPPPEKYDPDTLSHWSITMMPAWILWGEIDAVRNESDDYRNECADWVWVPTARARAAGIAMKNISTGQIAPCDPDHLQKDDLDLQKGSWHLRQRKPSGWNGLYLAARFKNIPPQVAINSLWLAAGEDRIKAIALECKNAKAFDGNLIEIPAHYWAHLKRVDDRSSGKAMLSGPDGRVYREVKFPRLDGKKLWPKSPPLSGEPFEHVENPEQTRPAELELLEPKAWLAWALKKYPKQRNERPTPYISRLHGLMEKADNVTDPWKYTFRIRYYDAVKAERQAVQKERKSPRTV